MTCGAANSIWAVFALSSFSIVIKVFKICWVLALVDSLPGRYRSTRLWGIGSMHSGWLRVAGFVCVRLAPGIWMSPICGSSKMRALWYPYSGVWVFVMMLYFV